MKKWNFSKVVASFLLLGLGSNAFANYNITDRYVLTEDKFKTTEMLRPLGHDFLIDIGGWMSSNIQDIISDADDASKKSTATEQLNAANDLLAKYDNTEQILRVGVNFGIPLFSFTAWGVKIVPDIRVNANFGVQTKIGSEVCTFDTLVKIIGSQGLPASVENQITNALSGVTCSQIQASPQNGNLITAAKNFGGLASSPAVDALETSGKASIPTGVSVDRLPTLEIYGKGEAKGSLVLGYELEEDMGKGYLGINALGRMDITGKATSSTIANGGEVIDLGEEKNTTVGLTLDFKYQYDIDDWKISGEVQDLKVATLSDNKDTAGELTYTIDPLIRLHAAYHMEFVGFYLDPFAGLHKRSQYDFADGVYAGADLSFFVWGDRLGIRARAMVDQEYFTLSPMLKLWIAHIDLGLKAPIKSESDGIKLSSIYHANLRIFF